MVNKQFITTLYKVEVGVLLKKDNSEYKDYSQVYDKKHAFYDENVVFFTNSAQASEFALSYVMKGVVRTYAIVSELNYCPEDVYGDDWEKEWAREKSEIENSGTMEDYQGIFESDLYDTKNIVLSMYKSADFTIKYNFVKE